MNKKFVYQVGNNKKVLIYWYICLACLTLQILMVGWPCILV